MFGELTKATGRATADLTLRSKFMALVGLSFVMLLASSRVCCGSTQRGGTGREG